MTRDVTHRRYEGLPRRTRHRLVLRAVLRPALTATCLMVVYFAVPLNREFTTTTAFTLTGGLLVFSAIIAWEAYSIAHAAYPRLRALEALATSVPLFLLLFATAYYLMENSTPDAFSEPLTRVDALYFTITVFSSVGFGDITPQSESARILTMVQMLGDLVVVGLVVRILLEATRRGLDRRTRNADDR